MSFKKDLDQLLNQSEILSRLRSRNMGTDAQVELLLKWQNIVFENLTADSNAAEISARWKRLHEDKITKQEAVLLHSELKAIIAFQEPLLNLATRDKDKVADLQKKMRWRAFQGRLKRAIGLLKIFLESLKDILGDVISAKLKIALQLGIEAAEVFA